MEKRQCIEDLKNWFILRALTNKEMSFAFSLDSDFILDNKVSYVKENLYLDFKMTFNSF